MLKNIKSNFFIKIIFSILDEERKLKLVKYNKNIKEKIDITLQNYKIFSGKYVIFETRGKEYNNYNDELLFEGEYLNKKRHGKGKEYKNNNLIFEGEYLNGKRNGKGFEYNLSGNLIFEGEYLNGKRWNGKIYDTFYNAYYELMEGRGFVKEYSDSNRILFEGEYLNGKRNGKGKEYYIDDLSKFEGEYLNGKKWSGIKYDELNDIIYEIKDEK